MRSRSWSCSEVIRSSKASIIDENRVGYFRAETRSFSSNRAPRRRRRLPLSFSFLFFRSIIQSWRHKSQKQKPLAIRLHSSLSLVLWFLALVAPRSFRLHSSPSDSFLLFFRNTTLYLVSICTRSCRNLARSSKLGDLRSGQGWLWKWTPPKSFFRLPLSLSLLIQNNALMPSHQNQNH